MNAEVVSYPHVLPFFVAIMKIWLATWLYSLLISISDDIKFNPGWKCYSNGTFSISHWNLHCAKSVQLRSSF